jgi:hypothetical protein
VHIWQLAGITLVVLAVIGGAGYTVWRARDRRTEPMTGEQALRELRLAHRDSHFEPRHDPRVPGCEVNQYVRDYLSGVNM